jgi:hypothetical protein
VSNSSWCHTEDCSGSCILYVASASTYNRILADAAYWCRILATTTASTLVFFDSSPPPGPGIVDATDVVGTANLRAIGDALGNASALDDAIVSSLVSAVGMTCIFSNSRLSIETK